jgi:hypothetical protein
VDELGGDDGGLGLVEPPLPGLGVPGLDVLGALGVLGVLGALGVEVAGADGLGFAPESLPLLCEGSVPVPSGTSWVPLR